MKRVFCGRSKHVRAVGQYSLTLLAVEMQVQQNILCIAALLAVRYASPCSMSNIKAVLYGVYFKAVQL